MSSVNGPHFVSRHMLWPYTFGGNFSKLILSSVYSLSRIVSKKISLHVRGREERSREEEREEKRWRGRSYPGPANKRAT